MTACPGETSPVHVDHCDTNPGHSDSGHVDSCFDFNNYADAWQDCAGHSDAAPELCPGAFQGNFYVDNTACHADTSHTNVAYAHTPHYNVYYHTPFHNVWHVNTYYHTPYAHTPHYNVYSHTPYSHTPFADSSHTNSCSGSLYAGSGTHYDCTCGSGYFCNWANGGSTTPPHEDYIAHSHSTGFGNTPHVNVAHVNSYSHTPFSNTVHVNTYYHTPFSNTAFSNSYYHTPFSNTAYSHTPFVNFCNHTDHNAG